jgi:alpha-tubulin suppressor-like RCC1 family protein
VGTSYPLPALVGGDVIEDGLSPIATLSAGDIHTCAGMTDGSAYCWGYGNFGQLGDSVLYMSDPAPRRVSGLSTVTSLSAGRFHTCAILANTTAACWGSNVSGQLGTGFGSAAMPLPQPVLIP